MTAALDETVQATAGAEPSGRLAFSLPAELEAHAPPAEGLSPETARMLVARRATGELSSGRLADLPSALEPGDVVVVNDSATLPAAVDAGLGVRVHFSGALPDGQVLVELREPAGASSRPSPRGGTGGRLELAGGGSVRLLRRWRGGRLWVAEPELPGGLVAYLRRHGQPIRYGSEEEEWPLEAAQTVFAREPGSAEAPSAALAFDRRLVRRLLRRGVAVETVTLHSGVASLEEGETPGPEWFRVPAATASAVSAARASGRRVVAVGTTVTRALESAWSGGAVSASSGWTELVITPERGVRAVDGLLTGWHEPEASHLDLLEAVAGRWLLAASYERALAERYRWHTFGDLHLILP